MQLEGTILRGRDFDPVRGRVVVEEGTITAIEETATESTDIILPAFVNAHAHLGDSIAKEAGEGLSLENLVALPGGLKHRLLRAASTGKKAAAMHRSLRMMEAGSMATCLEFREGGVEGVDIIRQAFDGRDIEAIVFGREMADTMEIADGFGAPGARDGEFGALRNATEAAGKLFGIHAGERDAHDTNAALDLDPDFLVHMIHPEALHLERVEDSEISIVIYPRSNLVTDAGVAPIRELVDRTTVALDTNNVILSSPPMFREMEFTSKLADVSAAEILRMVTVNGADIAGLNYGLVEGGRGAKFLAPDGDMDNLASVEDVVRAVVRRARQADVKDVYLWTGQRTHRWFTTADPRPLAVGPRNAHEHRPILAVLLP